MKKEHYTDLFSELGYSQLDIDKKITRTWQEMFEGPDRIYFDADNAMGYMLDTGNIDVRTEGMSYGMMMAVQMNRQDIFDKLWKWTKTYMYLDQGIHAGYFAWSCKTDGTKNAYGPAPDGEEFFAMALFFASHRWGEREKPFDYNTEAKDILRSCLHNHETEKKWTVNDLPEYEKRNTGYSMWDKKNYLIKFIPEVDFTDPSYHLPHFYDLFALWSYPEDRDFWKKAAQASRNYLSTCCHSETGFAPEYSYYNGQPHPHFEKSHIGFFSDSYRVAANIGLNSEWSGKSDWQKEIIDKIQKFFSDIDIKDYKAYTIEGKPENREYVHRIGLLATNAMGSLATEGAVAEKTVRQFWNTPLRRDKRRYYDNCLYFFALLALSGNFKIY